MSESTQVVVVGAGITGLVLGHRLARAGVDHLVLEAEDRPGGVIRSGRVGGHLLEWGPQRTRMTRSMATLVDELGLRDEVITAPPDLPLFVYRAGKLRRVPFSPAAFIASDIVPFGSKLRLLLEPLTRGASHDESVADYFIRKLGRPVYENIAGPLYGGLYASDPADMVVGLSLGHVLAEFGVRRSLLLPLLRRGGVIEPPVACSFRDGMETLPRRLAEADRGNVRFGVPAVALRRDASCWVVEHPGGGVRCERVVLTTPAGRTADLLRGEARAAAQAVGKLRYNPLAVVHLRATTDLRGLGFQVSLAERLVTRGVTFNDSLFGRTGVYTAYLGGSRVPEAVDWKDEELETVAVREFRQITGFDARALHVAREWMPAWDRSWGALERLSIPPGLRIAANWESRPGIPGRLAQAERLAAELTAELGR